MGKGLRGPGDRHVVDRHMRHTKAQAVKTLFTAAETLCILKGQARINQAAGTAGDTSIVACTSTYALHTRSCCAYVCIYTVTLCIMYMAALAKTCANSSLPPERSRFET